MDESSIKKEDLLDLLRDNLSINVEKKSTYDGKTVKVTILFDGQEICSDYYYP